MKGAGGIRNISAAIAFGQEYGYFAKHARRLKEKLRKKFEKKPEGSESNQTKNQEDDESLPSGSQLKKNE